MKTLGIAASGMQAQQTNVDVIANNIANASTTGFKSSRAAFQDLMYQGLRREMGTGDDANNVRPVSVEVGLGVKSAGVMRLVSQGGLDETENQLDLAIDGKGYFIIQRADDTTAYTRAGNFGLNADGEIVTLDGELVDPGLTIPDGTTSIEINEQGMVYAYVDGAVDPEEIGQITLATFVNEAGLRAIGSNLLQETVASGEPTEVVPGEDGIGTLHQGFVESSNVDTVTEITNLITAQRTYEMNSKAVTTADQMMQTVTQIR
jgi:flagellar basal-body rod protein FlgG